MVRKMDLEKEYQNIKNENVNNHLIELEDQFKEIEAKIHLMNVMKIIHELKLINIEKLNKNYHKLLISVELYRDENKNLILHQFLQKADTHMSIQRQRKFKTFFSYLKVNYLDEELLKKQSCEIKFHPNFTEDIFDTLLNKEIKSALRYHRLNEELSTQPLSITTTNHKI